MRIIHSIILLFSFLAAFAAATFAFEQAPQYTNASIILGFPGFVFGMMIFPGVHADKQTIVAVMTIVNAVIYFLVFTILANVCQKRLSSSRNDALDNRDK
jgi:hypothetical protein